MHCSNCGTVIEEGDNFCPKCGAPASAQARMQAEVSKQHVTEGPIKKWFEYERIRDAGALTEEQQAWLREGSITGFGPFNILVRRHWDIVTGHVVLNIISSIAYEFAAILLLDFALLAAYVLLLGYTYRHGRRLAWNRLSWNSFDDFVLSEKKWKPWGWVGVILIILANVASFFEGFNAEYVPEDIPTENLEAA